MCGGGREREGGGARDVRVLLERAGGRERELRGGRPGLGRGAPVLLLGPAPRALHPAARRHAAAAQVRSHTHTHTRFYTTDKLLN